MYATEVVYTRLLTALAASNNKPATCIIHNHTSVYDIPRVSICSTGYTPGEHLFNWAFGCARPFGWGPPTTGRPHRLAVTANAKTHKSLLTLPQHIFILPKHTYQILFTSIFDVVYAKCASDIRYRLIRFLPRIVKPVHKRSFRNGCSSTCLFD